MIHPTGFTGGEVPYRDYLGEDGYKRACERLEWNDVESAAVHAELMDKGKVYIVRYDLSDAAPEYFGWES